MTRENICKFNAYRSSDLICTDFVCESNGAQSAPKRSHGYSVNIVVAGRGTFITNGISHKISEGTLFFVCRDAEFSVIPEGKLEYIYVNFDGRRASEYIQRLKINDVSCTFDGNSDLIPFWQECERLAEAGNIDIVCEAAVLFSLAKLKPDEKTRNDVVGRMITLTHESFTDPELSLSSLADAIGYDSKYVSSLFKKRTGIAYTSFLRDLRLKHSVFLMEQGVTNVKNVAFLSGFDDPLYFSKVFTSSMGVPPKTYIKNLQKQPKN